MSTIRLTINTPNPAPYPFNYGRITISFNDGANNISLFENLSSNKSNANYFQYIGNQTGDDARIAANFATSFNRDYKNVGGSNNLYATVSGKVVTITANNGTFNSGSYNGNMITLGSVIENVTPIEPLAALVSYTHTGDCTTINWDAVAADGVPPYKITYNGATVLENWDGNNYEFPVNRGAIARVVISDAANQTKEFNTTVARKLRVGEFKEQVTQYEDYSDVLIENVNPVAFTEPITYSLDVAGTTEGSDFQTSNSFTGVLAGSYELFIKDVYGCTITKTIEVTSIQENIGEFVKYFDISFANSILFSPNSVFDADNKKNFRNTSSRNELTGIRYNANHRFVSTDKIGTQFKSSYPYHIVTLHRCDGTKKDIPFLVISENIGSKEKVDVQFAKINDKTVFYFDGGNMYEPNTTTVIGASEYSNYSPTWATIGQLVFFDGLGGFEILEEGYDPDLGKGYFVTDLNTELTEGIVQATFNKHDYDTYEFYLDMADVTNKGVIVVEYGFSFTEIDGVSWVSETIQRIEDTDNDVLMKWYSYKNIDPIVFQSGIEMKARMKAVFRPIFSGESETTEGDSRVYSIDQTLYQNYRLEIDYLTAKQVYQLCVATGVEFEVNNVKLTRLEFPEIEQLGKSNYYTFKVDLAYSGNILGVVEDESVLNISTGVIGGGSAKTVSNDDRYRLNVDSGFFTVGGDFVAV